MASGKKSAPSSLSARARGLGTRLAMPSASPGRDPLVAALASRSGSEAAKAAKVRDALFAAARAGKPGHQAGVRQAAVAPPKPVVKPESKSAPSRPPVAAKPAVRPPATESRPAARAVATAKPAERAAASSHEVRRLADPPKAQPKGDSRRQYPRSELSVRAKLALVGHPDRSFEATLPTHNISVGGVFFQSTFFLKLGTALEVTLALGEEARQVRARGQVVRVETLDGVSGFAVRFTEYLDGSEVVLATHFLAPRLRSFLQEYATSRGTNASAEWLEKTIDVLAAWELKRAELGGDVWGEA